jgi:catechol 2,3-dioxygenase-like lactoylglutathione lyase family enzyme
MPTVNGIVETSLYVADLDRAVQFYRDLLGLRVLLHEQRLCALQVGDRQVLLLFRRGASTGANEAPQGGTIPGHDARGEIHIGLAVAAAELPAWEARLRDFHVEIESRVPGPRGGTSLYFRDPDRNLVELLTPGVWEIY